MNIGQIDEDRFLTDDRCSVRIRRRGHWRGRATRRKMLGRLLERQVRPAERRAGEQHVFDQRFDRRFADQAHEEQLLDHICADRPKRRQTQQQLAEPTVLVRVVRARVLLQRQLRFLLQILD